MIDFAARVRALEMIQLIGGDARDVGIAGQLIEEGLGDDRLEVFYGTFDPISKGIVISRHDRKVRVCIEGVYDTRSSVQFCVGYGDPAAVRYDTDFNWKAAVTSLAIWDQRLRRILRPGDSIAFHGHSAGGVIAEDLAVRVRVAFPEMPISIDTYGSPAPSLPGAMLPSDNVDRHRWMALSDPVPLFPNFFTSPGYWSLIAVGSVIGPNLRVTPQRMGRFVQPSPGYHVGPDGYYPSSSPVGVIDRATAVSRWIDRELSVLQFHDTAAYLIYFRRLASRQRDLGDVRPGSEGRRDAEWEVVAEASGIVRPLHLVMPMAPPPTIVMPFSLPWSGPTPATSAPPDGVRPIVVSSAGRVTSPIGEHLVDVRIGRSPMAFTKVKIKKGFRAVKMGDKWNVALNDTIILDSDVGYRPTAFVRRGNNFLRSIGTRSTLFPTSLLAALSSWIAGAAAGGEFANPAIRIEL